MGKGIEYHWKCKNLTRLEMLTTIRYTPIKELDENRYSAKRMNVK